MPYWRILLVIVIGLAAAVALWLLGAVLMGGFLRGAPAHDAARYQAPLSGNL
jgi:hypothetical protein